MDKLKWAYITGEVWAFLQVHNLMPVIVAFAVGWYVAYMTAAKMDRFKFNYMNDKINMQVEINQIKDEVHGVVKGVATNSAIIKELISPTPTPKIIKKLLVEPSVDQSSP